MAPKPTGSRVSVSPEEADAWLEDFGGGTGEGGSLLEGYVPAPAAVGGAGGRLLDTAPATSINPVAISESMVPGVGPALTAGRAAIGQAAGAAGRMPGTLVSEALGQAASGQAQRWDPATRGVGLPGPEAYPMPPMTMRLASGSSSNSTSTTSPAISPEQAAGMTERMKAWGALRGLANEQLGGIDQRRLGDEEGILRTQQAQVQKAQARAAKRQAENAELMANQRERLEKIQESIKPNFDYYRGKWGGLRAMGDAIAIGLAGMGQAMMAGANIRAGQPATLGPNPVLASIERAYERDMKAQLAEMADRKWKYEQGRNMLADLRRESGDIREALAQAKLAYLDEANLQVKMIRAKYGAEAAPWLRDIDDAGVGQAAEMQRLAVVKAGTAREVKTRTSGGGYSTHINPAWALRQKEESKGGAIGKQLPAGQIEKIAGVRAGLEEFGAGLALAQKSPKGIAPMIGGWIQKRWPGTPAESWEQLRQAMGRTYALTKNKGAFSDKDEAFGLAQVRPYGHPQMYESAKRLYNLTVNQYKTWERALGAGRYDTSPFKANPAESR